MKWFLALTWVALSWRAAGSNAFEQFSPHLSTNCVISWQAAVNQLPPALPIYKTRPRIFSAGAISSAIELSGFPCLPGSRGEQMGLASLSLLPDVQYGDCRLIRTQARLVFTSPLTRAM